MRATTSLTFPSRIISLSLSRTCGLVCACITKDNFPSLSQMIRDTFSESVSKVYLSKRYFLKARLQPPFTMESNTK